MKTLLKALILLLATPLAVAAQITVKPHVTHQRITGWEAVAQAGIGDFGDFDDYKTSLMDQAIADGLNRFKINVRIDTESDSPTGVPVNDNADPFVINDAGFQWGRKDSLDQMVQPVLMARTRLAALGEPMPYVILGYVDFDAEPFEHHTNAEEYAEFIEAAFIRLDTVYGFTPDAVEIMLEPDSTADWTATKMTNCLLAARSRLASHGWYPRFIAPSTLDCWAAQAWYENMKSANSAVTQYIDEVSMHWYGNCDATQLANLKAAAEADSNRISMLEWIGVDYTLLHSLLKSNLTGFEQFALAYDNTDSGGHYYLVDHTSNIVTISSRMRYLRQYFKYIRRDALRVEATTSNSNFDPVVFLNKHTYGWTVVVKATAGAFTISGMPAGTYHRVYTTAADTLQSMSDQTITAGQDLSATMPAAGVITFFTDAPTGDSFYVSPTGSGTTCSLASPCALQTALSGNGGAIGPGDKVYGRDGEYLGKFFLTVSGTSGSLIEFLPYPGEQPVINGYVTTTLNGAIDSTQTTLSLADGARFPAGSTIIIADQADPGDEEHINLPDKAGNDYSNIQRGWNGTTAQSHSSGATVILGGNQLEVSANYVRFQGWEIKNTDPVREQIPANAQNAPHLRGEGVFNTGDFNEFINLTIHNVQDGVFNSPLASGTKFYGILIYNVGYKAGGAHNGQGMYLIHEDTVNTSYVQENIVLNSSNNGIKGDSQNGDTRNIYLEGNIAFNNGSWPQDNLRKWQLLAARNTGTAADITVKDNHLYIPGGKNGEPLRMGIGGGNGAATVTGNRIGGGGIAIFIDGWNPLTFTGNNAHARDNTGAGNHTLVNYTHTVGATVSWDSNNYWNEITGGNGYFYNGSSALSFTTWKSTSGFDAASTQTIGAPSSNWISVRPNVYQTNHAHVAVFNWTGASSVNVDLSPAFAVGTDYVVYAAENYGVSIASGTYTGAAIAIPINGTTVAQPIGWTTNIATVRPEFGAFIVTTETTPPPPPSGSNGKMKGKGRGKGKVKIQ